MGLVLWIDQNTFASSLIEKVFRKENLPFYSVPQANDFVYLVEDLRPRLIVLDSLTAAADLEKFKEQYEKSQILRDCPFIVIDPREDLKFIHNQIGVLTRPFDPFKLPEEIASILNAAL